MKNLKDTAFTDRLENAAKAKQALLARMKPKPTVTAETFVDREATKKAELEAVRAERAAARQSKRDAADAAAQQVAEEQAKKEEAKSQEHRSKQRAELLAMYGRPRRK